MMEYLANGILGYLLGSVPFGLLAGYIWAGKDIRQFGSGKTGTTNVLRTAGRLPAVLVLVADIAKGVVPGAVGQLVFDSDGVAAVGAGAAVAGHVWPVFASFRGGRGVATTFGGVLGLTPVWSLLFPVIGLLIVVPTRIMSLMSVLGTPICAGILAVLAFTDQQPASVAWYGLATTLLVEYKHIPNIRRLLAGTEPRLGRGGDRPATG